MTIIKTHFFLESGIIFQWNYVNSHCELPRWGGQSSECFRVLLHTDWKEGTVMAPEIYLSITPMAQDFKELQLYKLIQAHKPPWFKASWLSLHWDPVPIKWRLLSSSLFLSRRNEGKAKTGKADREFYQGVTCLFPSRPRSKGRWDYGNWNPFVERLFLR